MTIKSKQPVKFFVNNLTLCWTVSDRMHASVIQLSGGKNHQNMVASRIWLWTQPSSASKKPET